jgi:DNA-binding CsgD family transcriptional regulator/N-acetylneuraminic acid mutarotase
MTDTHVSELSEREQEILRLIATGASNKEIAQKLVISLNTVKVHARNIFSKIGVASRTEAALYAMRAGLVDAQLVKELPEVREATPGIGAEIYQEMPVTLPPVVQAEPVIRSRWARSRLLILGIIVVLLVVFSAWGGFALQERVNALATVPAQQLDANRWETLTAQPTPREGLAVTVFEERLYAIAGQDSSGVSASMEVFDPSSGSWAVLTSKPTAVKNVHAAVLGGKIYVPGGELADGSISDILEIYNPREEAWATGTNLPLPLSAYSLVSFEGRLYLFGGWDGSRYRDETYVFDPVNQEWKAVSSMKTARAFAGAAVTGGRIFVVGGMNSSGDLASVEIYHPELEGNSTPVWTPGKPLPVKISRMAVTSIADILYVAGGSEEDPENSGLLEYHPAQDQWQKTEMPVTGDWSSLGLAAIGSRLYLVGGTLNGESVSQGYSFQAIYTVLIPLAP